MIKTCLPAGRDDNRLAKPSRPNSKIYEIVKLLINQRSAIYISAGFGGNFTFFKNNFKL